MTIRVYRRRINLSFSVLFSMKQDRFQWLVVVMMGVLAVGFGCIVFRQQQLIHELSRNTRVPLVSSQQVTSGQAVVQGRDIARVKAGTETPNQSLAGIEFIHRCIDGEVTTRRSDLDGQTHAFCVGKNQLFAREMEKETLIDERMVREVKDAPILFQADVISSPARGRSKKVLVSYATEVCTTMNDCGVGMPNQYVRYLYTLGEGTVRALNGFPEQSLGLGVWNPSFTKAIFYPKTCGGAGCERVSLFGYDLERDQVVPNLTRDTAAEPGLESPDVNGKPLPMWGMLEWTSDTVFKAQITDPADPSGGTVRTVTGRF